jgi:maleate cis-trans isomerase
MKRPPRKLGIVAAPGWFDPTLHEFMQRHPDELVVTQTILPPPGFDWSFEQISQSGPALMTASRLLAEAGSEIIAQVGPAFAYRVGGSASGARELGRRLSAACGVPVVLNGVTVLDTLQQLGCRRVAVACPYYSPPWKHGFVQFLEQQGLVVVAAQTFVEQGLFDNQEQVTASNYGFSEDLVRTSVRRTRAAAPDAEAMLITGSGVRTLRWLEDMEAELGLPLVSADGTLYRGVLRLLDLQPNARGPWAATPVTNTNQIEGE